MRTDSSIYFYNIQLKEGTVTQLFTALKLLIQDLQENWISGFVILIMQHADMAKKTNSSDVLYIHYKARLA